MWKIGFDANPWKVMIQLEHKKQWKRTWHGKLQWNTPWLASEMSKVGYGIYVLPLYIARTYSYVLIPCLIRQEIQWRLSLCIVLATKFKCQFIFHRCLIKTCTTMGWVRLSKKYVSFVTFNLFPQLSYKLTIMVNPISQD